MASFWDPNKLVPELQQILVKARAMAQKQLEERMKMGEKEILGLKKLIFDLTKSVEKLLDDVNKRQDVSCAADGYGLKMKGKVD